MSVKTYRAWINQPSELHPLHKLHGKPCIAVDTGMSTIRLWFTTGDVHSIEAPRNCVSRNYLSDAESNRA